MDGLGRGLAALLSFSILTAEASGLRVTPLRLELSAEQRAAHLELQNLGTEAVPVEVRVFEWRQEDGKDHYTPTSEIFVAPPISNIPTGSRRTVRFLNTRPPAEDRERSFRVYVEELAPAEGGPNSNQMAFRMRFGVPLFVEATGTAAPDLSVKWLDATTTEVQLELSNAGNRHIRVQALGLFAANRFADSDTENWLGQAQRSDGGTNYLLPGSTHRWTVPVTSPGPYALFLQTNDFGDHSHPAKHGNGRYWFRLSDPH